MSQCRYCNNPNFTLDRDSGTLTCAVCGRQNLVGSPSYYSEGITLVAAKKTNKPDESIEPFLNNSIGSGGMMAKPRGIQKGSK